MISHKISYEEGLPIIQKIKKKHHHLKLLREIYDDYKHKLPGHFDREFQTHMSKARTTMSMLKALDDSYIRASLAQTNIPVLPTNSGA